MAELFKSFIVRPAQELSPKQTDSIAIKSHPEALQSKRFRGWMELCEANRYAELQATMSAFLDSKEAHVSLSSLPDLYRKPLEFAQYHGYKFSAEAFMLQLDIPKFQGDCRQAAGSFQAVDKNIFLEVYSNFADQLIADAAVRNFTSKTKLDNQAIIKTLHLIERLTNLKEERRYLNIDNLYAKPIILPSCILQMDPCRGRIYATVPAAALAKEGIVQADVTKSKEPDCGCGKAPVKGPCDCSCDETCVEQNPCCADIVPYIADLYVVKEEVSCYEPGEMSYIENILESEIRERTQRNLEREELDTEHEEETTSFEQREHQVDEKFSLQKEIDKSIEQTLSMDAGVTAHQKWGTGDVTATTNAGYNQSKKDAQKTTQNNAKDIIDKSISSLQKKVRDFASRKLLRENEEINKHVFGGTSGAPQDISRQFYYVNQVKKGQVFSWGKRQLMDFYIPEPSELYKRLIEKKFNRKKPVKPCITISEISGDKYLEYIKCYGIKDIEFPPVTHKLTKLNFSKDRYTDDYRKNGSWQSLGSGTDNGPQGFDVPDGYIASSIQSNFNESTVNTSLHNNGDCYITISLAGKTLQYGDPADMDTINFQALPPLEGNQSVSVFYNNLKNYGVEVIINFTLKPEGLLKWQLPVYYKIMEAYEKELTEYNEALAAFEKTKEVTYRQNPFLLLQDIQEQLKQAAISYLSCQFFDGNNAMKQNVMPCGLPQFDIPEAKKEGEFVRFFEQAFEWKFMNFIFYPYFWSRKCTWEKKINEQADNMLFQRFLRAGFARVSVSVRQGFEGHVNYYLITRKIFAGTGIPPVMGTSFLPIYQEIKEDKDNFYTDREGKIEVSNGDRRVRLTGTDQYWDPIAQDTDFEKIKLDNEREMFIDCKAYKIIDIHIDATDPLHKTWEIILDRDYEGKSKTNLPWSTGAVFIGAPWEFRVPTRLVWLREKGGCLPCYPIKCEDKP